MASSAITNTGRDWIVDRVLDGDEVTEQVDIAVGTGTTAADVSDTSLEAEEHRSAFSDGNASLYDVAGGTGVYRANITISGGIEVPAGTDVTEFGIFNGNGDLIYREVRNSTTVADGERISFELEIEFVNQ